MRIVGVLATLAASLALSSCSGTPTQPTSTLTVSSVTPASGTTLGGTPVIITGRNFSVGATLIIGGIAATDVTVAGPTTLTAKTGQHAAGIVDVVVAAAGRTGSLTAAFTYVFAVSHDEHTADDRLAVGRWNARPRAGSVRGPGRRNQRHGDRAGRGDPRVGTDL